MRWVAAPHTSSDTRSSTAFTYVAAADDDDSPTPTYPHTPLLSPRLLSHTQTCCRTAAPLMCMQVLKPPPEAVPNLTNPNQRASPGGLGRLKRPRKSGVHVQLPVWWDANQLRSVSGRVVAAATRDSHHPSRIAALEMRGYAHSAPLPPARHYALFDRR